MTAPTSDYILLSGVTGSTAHGLNTADSDTDISGIFAAPTLEIAGLDWNSSRDTYTTASPIGDDETYHEIAKAMRTLFKCNPSLMELLWLDEYVSTSKFGDQLVAIRNTFLSAPSVKAVYTGFARSTLAKFTESEYKPRYARHTLRLLRQGMRLYTEGVLIVKVDDPQEYFDIEEMTPGAAIDKLSLEFDKWDDLAVSALPDEADKTHARELLDAVRTYYLWLP